MGRVADWFGRKVKAPLLAELNQGATPAAIAAAIAVSGAIAINPIIGSTTVLCLLVGRLFRLNHVVMQIINYLVYPLQFVLLVPFVRLGETLTGAEPLPLSPSAIIEAFQTSTFSDFFQKFWGAYVHGLIGWALIAPLAAIGLYFILRPALSRFLPPPPSP